MRNAILMFASTLLAVLVGLALFHAFVNRGTPMERALKQNAEQKEQGAALVADFAQATGAIRTAVAEYYANTGKLPQDNAACGLPPPDAYRGRTLQSATVDASGAVTFVFDGKSGKDGGRIRLVADISDRDRVMAMGVQWRCETADYPQISHLLPYCEYKER